MTPSPPYDADQTPAVDGMDIATTIARRETRLKALEAAKAAIEARAQERFACAQTEYEANNTVIEIACQCWVRYRPG